MQIKRNIDPEHSFNVVVEQDKVAREKWKSLFGAQADRRQLIYTEYAQYESWNVDEATALLLGTDPKLVSPEFREYFSDDLRRDYFCLRARVERKFGAIVAPTELLAWADKQKVNIFPELIAALNPSKKIRASDEVNLLNAARKIMIAMAMEKYGYKKIPRSVVSKVKNSCELIGLRLDEATIKKHLDSAYEANAEAIEGVKS
ncbi:hypothetical protein AB8B21_27865 [Tardiphaga sp. 866_E4_N2_1]|uniref:hypothetical protein n=1 Tax=unclassified Tardiphaga TaxID=2631404 RepID=UPI003F228F78